MSYYTAQSLGDEFTPSAEFAGAPIAPPPTAPVSDAPPLQTTSIDPRALVANRGELNFQLAADPCTGAGTVFTSLFPGQTPSPNKGYSNSAVCTFRAEEAAKAATSKAATSSGLKIALVGLGLGLVIYFIKRKVSV